MHGWDSGFSLFVESSPITLILPERLQGRMVHVLKCSCAEMTLARMFTAKMVGSRNGPMAQASDLAPSFGDFHKWKPG